MRIHGNFGKPKSEEQKRKQSRAMKKLYAEGKLKPINFWKNKTFSEKHKNNLRLAILNKPCPQRAVLGEKNYFFGKSQKGELNPMFGKKQSEESKQKNREKHLGKTWKEESLSKMKKTFEIKNIHKGENNPMFGKRRELSPTWIDGRSFIPYTAEFNLQFKKEIKQRDNFMCLKCNISNSESKKKYSQGLHIHHIDFNKLNTCKENCCCLCLRCNVQVNFNREHWTQYFQDLLHKKYNYLYPKEVEVII